MMRGNEKRELFLCDQDRIQFIDTLRSKKGEDRFSLYAYCLMSNHIHLVLKEESDSLSNIMKRINISYALYFNTKYERVGHLFQDRYLSEPIESEDYLLAVIRYVHNNPVKAGIVKLPERYRWSSYREYLGAQRGLVDCEEILEIFSKDRKRAVQLFKEFSCVSDNRSFLDMEQEQDSSVNIDRIIQHYLHSLGLSLEEIKKDKAKRDKLISDLKFGTRASVRQIAQALGVDRNIVQRVR